jgi:hypothetical protein
MAGKKKKLIEEQQIPKILDLDIEDGERQLQYFLERLKLPYKKYVQKTNQVKTKGRVYSHVTAESFVYAMHEKDGFIKLPIYRIITLGVNPKEFGRVIAIHYFFEAKGAEDGSREERHFFHESLRSKGIHSALIEAYLRKKDYVCETVGPDLLLALLLRSW